MQKALLVVELVEREVEVAVAWDVGDDGVVGEDRRGMGELGRGIGRSRRTLETNLNIRIH